MPSWRSKSSAKYFDAARPTPKSATAAKLISAKFRASSPYLSAPRPRATIGRASSPKPPVQICATNPELTFLRVRADIGPTRNENRRLGISKHVPDHSRTDVPAIGLCFERLAPLAFRKPAELHPTGSWRYFQILLRGFHCNSTFDCIKRDDETRAISLANDDPLHSGKWPADHPHPLPHAQNCMWLGRESTREKIADAEQILRWNRGRLAVESDQTGHPRHLQHRQPIPQRHIHKHVAGKQRQSQSDSPVFPLPHGFVLRQEMFNPSQTELLRHAPFVICRGVHRVPLSRRAIRTNGRNLR